MMTEKRETKPIAMVLKAFRVVQALFCGNYFIKNRRKEVD